MGRMGRMGRHSSKSIRQSYLDTIYALDWLEKPVGILQFISDPEYIGKCTNNGDAIFPGWKPVLQKIFEDPTKYIIVFTGAMGLGKTFIAIICMAYINYLIHCLKSPYSFVGTAASGKFAMSFFNLNKGMSDTVGYAKLQNLMSNSPWFRRKAARIKEGKSIEIFLPLMDLLLSSPNCLAGGTKIPLMDGRELPIEEVIAETASGKELWAYSVDVSDKKILAGRILGGAKVKRSATVLVTLDSGDVVRCTGDHKFMLCSGEYKFAKDLVCEDSLMPLCRAEDTRGYERHFALSVMPGEECDVFDITVEHLHNFAVSAGVFVSNSGGYGITGADIISGILDEVDSPNAGITQKKKVLSTYEQTIGRFKNRFVTPAGKSLGKFFIVTSKQETMGFVDTFIAEKKKSPEVLVFDFARWEIRPTSEYCGKKFMVAIPGDAFHEPKILAEQDDVISYQQQGYEMLSVPIEHKLDFEQNLVQEIRNTAGRSIASVRNDKLFKSESFIKDCFDASKQDPMKSHTIEIGLKDEISLIWFLDINKLRMPKETPRFIHMDFGLSGDALGLSMCGVSKYVDMEVEQQDGSFQKQRLPVVETDFVFRLKAKENDSIPLHKVSKFVLDLRAASINIQLFSSDLLLASAYAFQVLSSAGITTDYQSVDKTDGPYVSWRDLVYAKRWVCHPSSLILFEAKHLIHDRKRQKVDHPDKVEEVEILEDGGIKEAVMRGSKDATDAICGAVYRCLVDAGGDVDLSHVVDIAKSLSSMSSGNTEINPLEHLIRAPDGKKIVRSGETEADRTIQSMLDLFRT